ncbi:MAG: methylenetetrahydrofolate reductase [Gammaproteobacteria bacterium]|nr:methylenetetrahydrofolate reductase [Gammaproteobacteria bacterium]
MTNAVYNPYKDAALSTFRQALRSKDFAISAELALSARSNKETILADARLLNACADAIQVPESVEGEVHLSPLAASAILLNAGIDPVMHMNCRDRNRIALQSELLGAKSIGVTSLLLMRGKEIPSDSRPKIEQVYDWGGRKLIAAANAMESADFMIGSIATVFKPDRDWKPEKLAAKIDAGVKFVQTQLCFDIDLLRHYMGRLVAEKLIQRVNVIVGLAPLPSADVAQWLGKTLRGAVVPAKIVKRLRQASDPEQEGVEICAEMLQQAAEIPGTRGANILAIDSPEAIVEAVNRSGVRNLNE